MSRAIAIVLCGLPKITDFCCNYFEVWHLYKLPASAYFKVRGSAFDLAVEVTQILLITPLQVITTCMYIHLDYLLYVHVTEHRAEISDTRIIG